MKKYEFKHERGKVILTVNENNKKTWYIPKRMTGTELMTLFEQNKNIILNK